MQTTIKTTLLSIVLSTTFLFSACSKPDNSEAIANEAVADTTESAFREIDWMDLMPEGEDEVLEKLYTEYYENMRKEIAATAGSEGSESSSDFDISSLIAEGAANDTMDQIGSFNVVESLDGEKIRIPGYIVPLDFNAKSEYTEFLLVPYFGACLHTSPPPPNQILFVNSATPATVASINDPVWLEGTLKTGRFDSDLANSAYELTLSKVEPYEF